MIKLEQYRDPWLGEKFESVIGFYPREFYCLDNFSSFKVEYKGYVYASLEEAYQSAMFLTTAPEVAEKIKLCFSAHEAQKIAFENKSKQRSDWDEVKLEIMGDLVRLKVAQNPYVKKKLLETGEYLIVEDSPKDSFWGWGKDRNGQNNLGKIWMEVRDEIVETEENKQFIDCDVDCYLIDSPRCPYLNRRVHSIQKKQDLTS